MLQAALDAGPSWNGHESCGSHQMSGTSMAAPAAAGTALLIRQFFMDKAFWAATCSHALPRCRAGAFVPSGYLVKAVFLHSGRGIARCGAVSQISPAFPNASHFPFLLTNYFLSPNFHDAFNFFPAGIRTLSPIPFSLRSSRSSCPARQVHLDDFFPSPTATKKN